MIHFACDGSGTAYDLAIADLGLHANLRFGGHGVISRIESFYWLLRRRVKCGVARGTGQFPAGDRFQLRRLTPVGGEG